MMEDQQLPTPAAPPPEPQEPTESDTIGKLAAALSIAQGALEPAEKNGFNPHFKSKFSTLADMVAVARAPLAANGLAVLHKFGRDGKDGPVVVTKLTHASGEWISSIHPVLVPKGANNQVLGTAIAYARRYSYGAIVGIASVEDDDGNASSGKS
jgi:hypothetical protein